jgi:glyoxylase-like metal-dependent hydrolase (beta-lactamase superfamily II)
VAPDEVDVVVLTHLHVDHVGWAAVDGAAFFARARYAVSDVDWRFVADRADSRETFAEKLAPLEKAGLLTLIELAEAEIGAGVAVRPTPGHTPGHISVEISGNTGQALILGDVAVHPIQLHDPRAQYVFEEDAPAAAATRQAVLQELADRDVIVAAGHFPGGLGRVTACSGGFGWRRIDS